VGPKCIEENISTTFSHKTETTSHFYIDFKWVLHKIYGKTKCYQHQKLAGWDKPNISATYDVKLEAVYLCPASYCFAWLMTNKSKLGISGSR
jgi:hypothetical protein